MVIKVNDHLDDDVHVFTHTSQFTDWIYKVFTLFTYETKCGGQGEPKTDEG